MSSYPAKAYQRSNRRQRGRELGRTTVATWCAGWLWGVTVAGGAFAAEPLAPPAPESKPVRVNGGGTVDLSSLSLAELMAVEVATVTTASKKPEKASDAPATVIVITENDIRLRGYATLKDVLRDLPGMETIESYFSEFGTQVPVRGINGNNKIAVLVNGMRVNPPGGENFPFRSDFSVRNVERIEVIYGPGSTLYGQDAISAVINVITKTASAGAHGEVGVAGGLNSEREGWATFGGSLDRAGNVKLSGHVMYHDSELTRLDREYPNWWKSYGELARQHGSGDPPERQDFGVNVFARLTYQDSSLQVWHRESKRSSSESGYPPAYVDEALWQDESTVVEGRNTATLTEDVKLDSMLTYNRYEIDPATRYVFAVPGLTNQWFLNDYKYGLGEGYTWEETLRMDLSDRISLLCGAMAGNYDIIPKSTAPGGADPDGDVVGEAGAWEYTVGSDPTRHPINRVARSEYQTYAGYTELAWRLDDRLRLVAGTRVTKDTRFDDLPITPRAALIYDLTESLIAKYIYSRAYVAPGPYFANATYDNGTLLATSNGDLEPEKAETHEVNLTYTRKRVSLGASAYYGEQSDIIVVSDFGSSGNIVAQDVFLDGDPAQRRTLVRTVNGGEGRRYGADLYGRATWGDACLWSSYSYVDSEETVGDMTRDAPGLSRHNARLGVTWAATSKLFVTPSLALRSTPQNTPAGELEDELSVPWDVNLHVLYQLTKQVDVFADLKNVTDHHYALAGFGNSGKAIPQETFHGMLGLRGVF